MEKSVEEVVMGDLLGEVFAGDPMGEAIVVETMSAPASKPFNGGSAMTSTAPFVFGLSTIQTAPSTSRGTAFSFGTGAPSLFTHARLLAAPPANPPPLSATVFRFEAGSTAAAFGALAPAAFESTPAGFRSIGQPAATKPDLTTLATTFTFGASLMPAAPTTAGFGRAPLFQFGTTPQPAQFQEDIPGICTHKANNKNEGTISTKTKEVMHPEGVEDKGRILVTRAQDDCRYIRKQIFESKFAFIMMCAAFLSMISIDILVLRLMRMFQEAHRLFNMAPEDTPKESQYPLDKLNYSTLYHASYETQVHRGLATQVTWRAGRRTALQERAQDALQQRQAAKLTAQRIRYNFSTFTMQIRHVLGLEAPTRHRPHPNSILAYCPSNKRLCKPD